MDRWEVFRGEGDDSEWYFHRKAENGEIVGSSEGYTRKESAVAEATRQAEEVGGTVEVLD